MKLFILMFGFVPRFTNKIKIKNNLYDTSELQHYPMNMFEDEDIFLKFKPFYFNTSGHDCRFDGNSINHNEMYNITRFFYMYNLLKTLQSNLHDDNKVELIDEYNKYNDNTSFMHNIAAGGLFDDWNNEIIP